MEMKIVPLKSDEITGDVQKSAKALVSGVTWSAAIAGGDSPTTYPVINSTAGVFGHFLLKMQR